MRHISDLRESRLIVLATGSILLILVGLVERPDGWRTSLCLAPLVAAACLLNGAYVAAASALVLILPEVFRSVSWVPHPTTVLFVVAVVGLIRIQQLGEDFRRLRVRLRSDEDGEWRTFFENSPAAILTADGEGRIVMANAAARKLLGFDEQPSAERSLGICIPALAAALRIERTQHVFHTITECKGWRPNGEMFFADVWFSINNTPLGTRLGAVIVDASERLQERERSVLRSSMATSQIAMGAVLHEIRNLSAAASVLHVNLERVPRLQANADFQALGNLVKALSKIASAELRPGQATQTSVSLRAVLDQLHVTADSWFRESEIEVKWNLAPDLPDVWGDAAGLLQILLNLAQNSIKAMSSSERKQLTISVDVKRDVVAVRFHDTGPGIATPDDLFQPFQRSSGVKGLGLYVSRAIAHSFCGDLKYVPTPSGTCFVLELIPLRAWQRESAAYGRATDYQNSPA
jgi:two-component system, LuxR family, sensor kinase FixL